MTTLLDSLAAVLPPDTLVTDPVLIQNYRYDWARDPGAGTPLTVVRPRSTADGRNAYSG